MPDSELDPIATFRRVADAISNSEWRLVAELCDPISLQVLQRQLLKQFDPSAPARKMTVEDLRRHQLDIPLAVAEYQVAQHEAHRAQRNARIDEEVAGVQSLAELAALSPVELFAKWLEAHTMERKVEQLLGHRPDVARSIWASVDSLPRERVEPIGVVLEGDWAYVLFHHSLRHAEADAESASLDRWLAGYAPEERDWLRDNQWRSTTIRIAHFRRQAGGSWRMIADQRFLIGGVRVGSAHIRAADGAA